MVTALVFLLTSAGGFGFHPKELAHDLAHHGQLQPLAFDHAHTGVIAADRDAHTLGDVPDPVEELEHQLLHAVDTSHLVTGSTANFSWDFATHVMTPLSNHRRHLPALSESPFRPPRIPAFV